MALDTLSLSEPLGQFVLHRVITIYIVLGVCEIYKSDLVMCPLSIAKCYSLNPYYTRDCCHTLLLESKIICNSACTFWRPCLNSRSMKRHFRRKYQLKSVSCLPTVILKYHMVGIADIFILKTSNCLG